MAASKGKLSTEPYKGVRDFYPADMALQKYLFGVMREATERFGFVEYSASVLEPAELYEAKTGEEIVSEQTYTFTDRGERRVTLRPEMTPSVARMVAARRRELIFPLRWYSIPNVFRYERPQRGRLREHWQLNADIFGVSGIEAEVESISLAFEIMRAFGAQSGDFEIRLNNRESFNTQLTEYKLTPAQARELWMLVDKKDKIENFDEEVKKLVGAPFIFPETPDSRTAEILDALKRSGVSNVRFDPTVVRGFDYYTGTVFEVFDTSPENRRSLFGGGRYDNLLEIFGAEGVPAVGFGMGDVTVRDFLETHKLLPELSSPTHLYLCTVSPEDIPFARELAVTLREQGVNVAVNLSDKKVGDQVKIADKLGVSFILCAGPDERTSRSFTLKNLRTHEEKEVAEKEIARVVLSS